jgi:uncharacterized phiE125 gp8 family phage protein
MARALQSFEALERVTAPAALPISVAEVKEQLRIEHSDDDDLIYRLISAAVAFTDVQGALGKAIITQTWRQWVSANPGEVYLMVKPVQSLTAVKYYDTNGALQTATLADYETFGTANSRYVKPASGKTWPTTQARPDAIALEYTTGYGASASAVPETIRHGLMMLIGHWYENRESSTTDRLESVPFGFAEMIGSERATWYG